MKIAAIALVILALMFGGCLGYALFNTDLHVVGKGLEVLPAAQRAAEFDALKAAVQRQSLLGTVLKNEDFGPAEDYSYYVYTLRLENKCLIPAEMVEMQISPIDSDVLFYCDTGETIIPAGETRDVWCVLLTRGTPHAVRDIYITYCLWGHAQEVKFTYDSAR
ncbi:MAG: hypothetical protein IJS41_00765 [Clostridia bacterium]|nr:hypothetical protein [Clostridia bacterium]